MPIAIRRFFKASPRLRRLFRRVKNAAVTDLARFGLWAVGRLSLEHALGLGEVVGTLLYRLLRRSRRLALEHLRAAFGDGLSAAARARLARASFINIARCFCELAKIDEIRARRDEYFDLEGWNELQRQLLAEGKGAVIVTGHIGNWELLAAYFAWKGETVAAIGRRIYAAGLNELLVDFRSRQGVETILRESPHATRQILRALKSKALLAMLIDQDTHTASVSVPFFGRLARTPAGAAALAIRRDLPAAVAFIQRRRQGGQRITISAPFVIARTGDTQTDIRALTRQFSAALQAQIRSNPAEWVWWHRRWRRPPLPQLDLDAALAYTRPGSALRRQE